LRSGGNIQVENLNSSNYFQSLSDVSNNIGPVIMQATGNIQARFILANNTGGETGYISLSAGGNISTEGLMTNNLATDGTSSYITVNAGDKFIFTSKVYGMHISTVSPNGGGNGGGNITIKAKGDISITCLNLNPICVETSGFSPIKDIKPTGNGGNITIISEQGAIIFQTDSEFYTIDINANSEYAAGNTGAVNLQARGDIILGRINLVSDDKLKYDSGNINIISVDGKI